MEHCNNNQLLPSLFEGVRNTRSSRTIAWDEVFRLITGGRLREETEKHRFFRTHNMEADAERVKHRSPCITPAVQCRGGRRAGHIVGYTGVSMVDLDHVPDLPATLALLRADPHTFMLYTTLSGEGVRVLYRWEPAPTDGEADGDASSVPHEGGAERVIGADFTPSGGEDETKNRVNPCHPCLKNKGSVPDAESLYLAAFQRGNDYFSRLTGLPFDPACKDAVRLSALCHDEGAYYNPESTPFMVVAEQVETKAGRGKKRAAAAGEPGVSGRVAAKLQRALARQGITYVEGSRNAYISRAGYLLNRYGVAEKEATDWAVARFSDYDGDVPAIIRACYQQTHEHGEEAEGVERKGKATRMATPQELAEYLKGQARFRHNVISGKTEVAPLPNPSEGEEGRVEEEGAPFTPLTDRHLSTLWRRFDMEGLRTTEEHLHSLIRSDFTPLYNPFEEYFASLPPWDGVTDYIARLAAYVHVTTDAAHFTHCLRKWLVGLVAGLFSEKVTNQVVLVLVGPQGCGKTTFFEYLLPPALYHYYCTKTNSNRLDKDDRLMLSEYALINFEELESMRTAEMNQLKAMITLRTVNDRRAYGRYVEQRPRIASFCGTGNALRFLNDPTGTRRWLPFEVTHIDDPRISPLPYEGIYSQALHLLRTGFRHWFTQDEVAAQATHNEAFEVPNPEEELIATYYRRPLPGEVCKFVTTTNIQERINAAIKQPLSLVRIAAAMKKMEFRQVRKGSLRGFLVFEYNNEQLRVSRNYRNDENVDDD